MADKATFLRVGLLIVAGLAAAIGMALFLSRDQVNEGLSYESYSKESVQGLDVGAPVKFRGVTVGRVTDIALAGAVYPSSLAPGGADSTDRLVVIRYTIDSKKAGRVADPTRAVQTGLRARLASPGITGLSYLELDFVDPIKFPAATVPWEPLTAYIPSMPSTIAQVQDAGKELLAKLTAVDLVRLTAGIEIVLDDLHAQLTRGDLNAVFGEAHTFLRMLRDSVEQANLPGVTADLTQTSASVRALVEGKPIRDMMASATQATQRLPKLIDALEAAVKRADDGVGDLQHDLAPVLRDAKVAASNLREATETLRRYPASLLLGAPPPREPAPAR